MRMFVVDQPRPAALRALNYAPEMEKIRRAGSTTAVPLASLLEGLGDSYWSVFTRHDCAPEYGVQLLTQTDMFASEPAGRVIRRDSMPSPDQHRVRKWQVLIAGAGQMGEGNLFGRSVIADDRLTHGYLGPHAVALTFADAGGVENLWVYAFLNTSVGIAAIKSTAFGTSVPGLRLDLLGEIPIPRAEFSTMRRVAQLIEECAKGRETYALAIRESRRLVEHGAHLTGASEADGSTRHRSVIWDGPLPSIRAWNFASMGAELQHLRREWSCTLQDWVEPGGVFKGGRLARVPCLEPHGVDLLSQRDVFAIRPVPRRIQAPNPPLSVGADFLLVASRGQMNDGALFGRVERGAHVPAGSAISEDILRIVPAAGLSEALYSFLSSDLGHRLLRTTAYGTSIPGMREDLLLRLPAPPPDGDWVTAAATNTRMATAARVSAAAAEAEAIRIVEEEVLPQWLA